MKKEQLENVMSALITPLNADYTVNHESLKKLIDVQIKKGIGSILVLGGTGEYLAFSDEQRKEVIDIAVQHTNKRVPVVVGLISPGIEDNVKIAKYAKESGADVILPVTPYYLTVSQQGFIDYYKELDRKVGMPMLLYNYPSKTNSNILPETVEKLVNDVPNVIGIKECTYDVGQVTELIARVGERITVMAGEEYSAFAAFTLGAKGAVMASSNVVPEHWVKLLQLVKEGKLEEARQQNAEYFPLYQDIFIESNPGPLKYVMNEVGLDVGPTKLPLLEISEDSKQKLNQLIEKYNIVI